MPISAELQQRYSTEVNIDWAEALIISHPTFSTLYMSTWHENITGNVDGAARTFLPVPFEITLPTRDGEGQQDMKLVTCNIGYELSKVMDLALTNPTEYIRCRYTVFIVGNPAPQFDPMLDLTLTDIVATELSVSATATRSNIFDLRFPRQNYTPARFPGLVRR